MIRSKAAIGLMAASFAVGFLGLAREVHAGFSATIFARGSDVSGTQPDSITYGGGHVFIEYANGANSGAPLGTGGASTIAEYDVSGKVLNTFSVLGVADGLRYNAATNQIWALQNQDGNSGLTTIDATTGALAHYTYSPLSTTRGFDDVAFVGGNAFMSYTNPTSPSDTILYQATLNNATGLVNLTAVLAGNAQGTNSATGQVGQIPVTDPDSLNLRPDGSLILTGEHDGSLTTIHNPGTGSQSLSFVNLVDGSGNHLTNPDDVNFASGAPQQLLVADTANNVVYSVQGPFQAGGAYVSIGSTNSLDSVDLTTGIATSISDGLFLANSSPHGLSFIPLASVPEPSSLVLSLTGLVAGLGYAWRLRK